MQSAKTRNRFPRRAHICIGAFVGVLASAASTAAGLTVPDLIRIALQDNRDLQAVRYADRRGRARLLQAGLRPNPRLEVTTANDRLFGNEGEYSAGISVSQQFSVAGRIALQKDVARVDVDLAMAEIKEAERKLMGEVVAVRFRILALSRLIAVRDRLIAVDQKLVDVTQHRLSAAEVSELDTNAAELGLQQLRQERAQLQAERATRLADLNQLLGLPASNPLNLDDAAPNPEQRTLEALQRDAVEHRPDLHSTELTVARARAELALARAERWEDWNVSLGVDQSRLVLGNGWTLNQTRALALTISIPLPILNKNQGRIAEAVVAEAQSGAQQAARDLGIRNEVATARGDAERLRAILVDFEQHTLPVTERNVLLAQTSYSQGLVTIVDVVQAQRQHGDLSVGYFNTYDQYLQALARLYTATGAYPE